MQITLSGHHVEITDALRDIVNNKLEKLERHYDQITSINVTLSVEKLRQKADASLHIAGADLVANAEHEDMYTAIDQLIDKLDRQLIKQKEKNLARQQGH
ncbi:Ribosome hibernation protein YhbH [gamma proteobacterium IMCC2047]|nr:Ribosome hibernation protein YhbH [gamma proteobacterium IMCC2047]